MKTEDIIKLDDYLANIRANWQEMDGEVADHPKAGLRMNVDAIEEFLSKAQEIVREARDSASELVTICDQVENQSE